jgi:integrase
VSLRKKRPRNHRVVFIGVKIAGHVVRIPFRRLAVVANMLVEDYLRPAAVKAGVLKEGEKVRFGFHNLRHSLASFLVRKGTDVKTVQTMLRHSDIATTLGIYAHSMSEDRLAAQDDMLAAMMTPSNAVN